MGCFKRLGEKVSARTFERQVVELNIRAAILNRSCSNQQQLAICQNAGFAYFQRSFGAGCRPTTNNETPTVLGWGFFLPDRAGSRVLLGGGFNREVHRV